MDQLDPKIEKKIKEDAERIITKMTDMIKDIETEAKKTGESVYMESIYVAFKVMMETLAEAMKDKYAEHTEKSKLN